MAANTNTLKNDITTLLTDAQVKAKSAYEKGGEVAGKAGGLAKANFEAAATSGKALGLGLKTLGEGALAETRSALETAGEDLKAFAAVKTPAELFLLQGKLAARNYETVATLTVKNAKAWREIAGKVFSPLATQAKANVAAVRPAQ